MTRTDLSALSTLDDPVRERLYRLVSEAAEPVGRDRAATVLGIDRALAAYHLDRLVDAGLLTASYRRPPGKDGPGAGRPAKLYSRSEQQFAVAVPPREYELAARLLAAAVAADPASSSRARLDEAARDYGTRVGEQHSAAQGARRARAPRTLEVVLREQGFEPASDEHTIVLRNCPFHELAARYPAVACGMNLALIEGLVAGIGATRAHPVLDPEPGRCCVTIGTGT